MYILSRGREIQTGFSGFPCPWTGMYFLSRDREIQKIRSRDREIQKIRSQGEEILKISVPGKGNLEHSIPDQGSGLNFFPVPGPEKLNPVPALENSVPERGTSMPRYAALRWPQGTPIIKTKETLRTKPYTEKLLTEGECMGVSV